MRGRAFEGLTEEVGEFVFGEVSEWVFLFTDDGIGELSFLLLQFDNALFDGVLADESVSEDVGGLAYSVRTVDGLRLDGGVPPGVKDEDVFGGGEVEAEAASFEADEEDGDIGIVLEVLDGCFAISCLAVEVFVGDVLFVESLFDQ